MTVSPFRRRTAAVAGAVLLASSLSACQSEASPDAEATPASATSPASSSAQPSTVATSSSPTADPAALDLAGKTIAVDPGHNGGNASHPDEIARPVPDGRGGTKACNTTGTATDSDYSEAEFTWSVAEFLTEDLEAAGAEVVLSREDNEGVGPCVDERGTFADDADVLVSIHANGSESSKTKGFHVIIAEPGTTPELEKASRSLAEAMSRAMGKSFTPNRAYGKEAISPRPDLAGLNNASVPAVMVECGEMRNPDEAAEMESEKGRKAYAEAIATGIADWF